jgi:hypothetical protein
MHASSKVHIDDVRILREFPATPKAAETAFEARARPSTASCSAPTTACWW